MLKFMGGVVGQGIIEAVVNGDEMEEEELDRQGTGVSVDTDLSS